MDWEWLVSLALLGLQALFAGLALVGLLMPLRVRFARRVHRYRVTILVLGLLVCAFPLLYFSQHLGTGPRLYYVKYLIASLLMPVAQVYLWYREDQRKITPDVVTRMR
jgi:hypothetical protein